MSKKKKWIIIGSILVFFWVAFVFFSMIIVGYLAFKPYNDTVKDYLYKNETLQEEIGVIQKVIGLHGSNKDDEYGRHLLYVVETDQGSYTIEMILQTPDYDNNWIAVDHVLIGELE